MMWFWIDYGEGMEGEWVFEKAFLVRREYRRGWVAEHSRPLASRWRSM